MDEETLEIRVEFDGSQALTLLMILKTGFPMVFNRNRETFEKCANIDKITSDIGVS